MHICDYNIIGAYISHGCPRINAQYYQGHQYIFYSGDIYQYFHVLT